MMSPEVLLVPVEAIFFSYTSVISSHNPHNFPLFRYSDSHCPFHFTDESDFRFIDLGQI